MDNKSERIVNIDILKGICAYLVVIIHYYFPIKHSYVEAIARVAVPVFFMVSGYYCDGEWEEVKRKVVRLLSIFLMGEVIYFIYNLYEIYMQWSQNGFSENNVISLIFNVEVFWVGWFLLALACMYVLFFVIKKMDLLKLGYILIPVAFLWEWIWQRENLLYGTNLEVMDFLIIRPFPFFMMGNFFHYKNNQIAEIMKKNAIYGFIILGLVTTVWERSFYDKITEERYFIYMGTFFLALGCFAYAVYLPEIRNMSWFAYVGKNLSVYIYLLHALVINIINERIGYMDITWVWIGVTILAYIVFQALEKTRRTVESIT